MIERAPTGDTPDGTAPTATDNKTPLYLTIGILAVMGLALAVDVSSVRGLGSLIDAGWVRGLVLLVVMLIGGLIAALAYYG